MNDDELKIRLQHAWRSNESAPPEFDAMWDAAESQAQRRTPWRAIAAGIGTIAVIILVGVNQLPESANAPDNVPRAATNGDDWVLDIDQSLLNATAWSAPSDALLPEADPDIFSTIPTIFESTDTEVDALL